MQKPIRNEKRKWKQRHIRNYIHCKSSITLLLEKCFSNSNLCVALYFWVGKPQENSMQLNIWRWQETTCNICKVQACVKYSTRSNYMHDADSRKSYHNLILTTFIFGEKWTLKYSILSTYAMTLPDVLNPGVEGQQETTLIPQVSSSFGQ